MKKLYSKVKKRINEMDDGEVFTIVDFCDIAKEKTISKFLERQCAKNKIQKVMRGIYWKPILDEEPSIEKVAYALARANNWDIAPSGKSALYLFGLIEEEPMKWEFVSNGSCRKYRVGNKLISIKHTTGKLLSVLSKKTILLVQVIKAYGKNKLPVGLVEKTKNYTKKEKEKIIFETKKITVWIHNSIFNLFEKEKEEL